MYSVILKASAGHAKQHPWPVLWLILAVTAAAAGLSAVLILNNAALQDYQRQSSLIPLHADLKVAGTINSVEPMTVAQHRAFYSQIRAAGFREVVAFQRENTQLTVNGDALEVTVYAVDAAALASLVSDAVPDPLGLVSVIAVSQDIAARLSADTAIALTINDQTVSLPWVSLASTQDSHATVLLDLHAFAQLNIALQPNYVVFATEYKRDIVAFLADRQLQYTPYTAEDSPIAITRSFHMSLLAMSLVMFLVCFFIVINALNLFMAGRSRMLKIFRQMGIPRTVIVRLLQVELALYALIGAVIGIFLGQLTAFLLAPSIATTLNNLFGVPVSLGELLHFPIYVPIIAICILATLISASVPIKRLASQLSHITPSTESSLAVSKALFFSLLLAGIALIGILFAGQLSMVFATVAMLLLSGVACLYWLYPTIIRLLVNVSHRTGPLIHWTFSHANVIAVHSRLACAAFFIALATHIGMTTMVDSFRSATEDWLQHRLIAEHYYYGDTGALLTVKERLDNEGIRTQERYQMNLYWQHENGGFAAQTYSYPATTEYLNGLKVEKLLPDGLNQFRAHRGLFINQQLAYRHGLDVGDTLSIAVADKTMDLTVVGIHYDFGNPDTQVLLPLNLLLQTTWTYEQAMSQAVRVMAIHTQDNIALKQYLDELGLSHERLYSRARLLEVSLAAFDQTFVITDALNLVTLLVAVFSLITSILLITNQTQNISGVLRSIGVTRMQLIASLIGQYLIIALITALCALPFGLALAYVLVKKVNVVAFQWMFPLTVDWLAILFAMVTSLVIISLFTSASILLSQSGSLKEQIQCRE
ncbi:ABC transporter permease [Alteromonas sp. ASW11-36]|uniref:ABC transporter permease n=1 Tax=Alteromonas arenosi TaxID=3055817 RepID=A0ABT7SU12_9ALTE|nr:ABC transporter permease [Alteromonas sp. ASW11-36]MDM7859665.1 ABC transporter permease [Alteromonas sp. ASW11-36]